MTVSVTLTGMLAASMKYKQKTVEISENTTVKMLVKQLELTIDSEWLAVSVNGYLKDRWTLLKDGDNVFITSAGGAG